VNKRHTIKAMQNRMDQFGVNRHATIRAETKPHWMLIYTSGAVRPNR